MIAMLRRALKVRTYVSPVQADGLFSHGWTTYQANAFQAFRHDWRAASMRVAAFNFWMTITDQIPKMAEHESNNWDED